jgi:hypothetical protein
LAPIIAEEDKDDVDVRAQVEDRHSAAAHHAPPEAPRGTPLHLFPDRQHHLFHPLVPIEELEDCRVLVLPLENGRDCRLALRLQKQG